MDTRTSKQIIITPFSRAVVVTQLCRAVASDTSGQYYKASTSINYDSRVILTSKLLIFTTLDS